MSNNPFNQFNSLYAQQFAQQQALFNNLQQASAGGYSNSYAPSYSAASATGAVGPGGVYQTASIYPQSVVSNLTYDKLGQSFYISWFYSIHQMLLHHVLVAVAEDSKEFQHSPHLIQVETDKLTHQ